MQNYNSMNITGRPDTEVLEKTIREVHKQAGKWEFAQAQLGTWLVHSRALWAILQILDRPTLGARVCSAAVQFISSVLAEHALLATLLNSVPSLQWLLSSLLACSVVDFVRSI